MVKLSSSICPGLPVQSCRSGMGLCLQKGDVFALSEQRVPAQLLGQGSRGRAEEPQPRGRDVSVTSAVMEQPRARH